MASPHLKASQLFANISVARLAPFLCGVGLALYFLFPYSIPALGISPHLLAFLPCSLLLLTKIRTIPQGTEATIGLLVLFAFISSLFTAPYGPNFLILRGWAFSILIFFVCRFFFAYISIKKVDLAIQILLILYALASLTQVYIRPEIIGDGGYVASCFGQAIGTRYGTGLAAFSNQAAVLLLPLLVSTLIFNVNKPTQLRSIAWMLGCAALYLSLLRGAWLAFIICGIGIYLPLRNKEMRRRYLFHIGSGLCLTVLLWIVPSHTLFNYAPGGSKTERWSIPFAHETTDHSAQTRLATLQVTTDALRQNPLSGLGLGAFPKFYKSQLEKMPELMMQIEKGNLDPRLEMTPHNAYAQFAAEMGLPAMFALLSYFAYVMLRLFRSPAAEARAVFFSLLGMFVFLLFHDGFVDRLFWILMGCGMGLATKHKKETT